MQIIEDSENMKVIRNNIYEKPSKHLFVHIPKTAGRSVFLMLNNGEALQGSHASARDYKSYLGAQYENYFSFAIVRNPWDRMVSLYFHRKQYSTTTNARNDFQSFEEFLWYVYDSFKEGNCNKFNYTQSSYICDGDKVLVKFIGRFETLEQDIKLIFEHIGIIVPSQLKHEHKTSREHYTKYYNDELVQIVNDVFIEDINRFNYTYK